MFYLNITTGVMYDSFKNKIIWLLMKNILNYISKQNHIKPKNRHNIRNNDGFL